MWVGSITTLMLVKAPEALSAPTWACIVFVVILNWFLLASGNTFAVLSICCFYPFWISKLDLMFLSPCSMRDTDLAFVTISERFRIGEQDAPVRMGENLHLPLQPCSPGALYLIVWLPMIFSGHDNRFDLNCPDHSGQAAGAPRQVQEEPPWVRNTETFFKLCV